MDTIDVTPNPRILQMLGEIAFEPWQCIAELVDNSIDAYLNATEDNPDYLETMGLLNYQIHVLHPNQQEYDSGIGKLTVIDSGPGMTLEEVRNAITAGFSGNDPLGKLGLFGMGFNIATARLGRLTRIKTSRNDDTSWLVVELDLDQMQKTKAFSAKFWNEEKDPDEAAQHGTIVEIHKLKREFKGSLTSGFGIAHIKRELSRAYSSFLSNPSIEMTFGGNQILPWKHCHWGTTRTAIVGSGAEEPCYIEVDQVLPENYFCNVCWHWSDPTNVTNDKCPLCTSPVVLKARRVHGWVGIQRYFDEEHYGVDFIRNGRVIEQLNKDCFNWNNEEGELELEYPLDALHWGGRIIGQINIDFGQVDYQKTKFQKNQVFKEVVEILRGSSPFRPNLASELGYPENTTPIGRLFKTFRGARPIGRRTLVPGKRGNELSGDNAEAARWAEQFHRNVPEYLTDDIWWERVEAAERCRRGDDEPSPDPPGGGVDDPFPEPGEPEPGEPEPGEPEPGETDYLHLVPELSLSYDFPDSGVRVAPIAITVYEDTRNLPARDIQNMPPLQINTRQAPHRYSITYHPKHSSFHEFAETIDDYILIQLSHWFSVRHGEGEWTATRVYQALKNNYQEGRKLNLQTLGHEAGALLLELKEHLATCDISETRQSVDPQLLRELEEEVMSTTGNIGRVDELLQDGTWIESVSDKYLTEVLGGDPTMVMDGRFFLTSYSTIVDNEDLRADTFDRIIGCLKDAIMIKKTSERMTVPDKQLLLRANAALSYLNSQRAS